MTTGVGPDKGALVVRTEAGDECEDLAGADDAIAGQTLEPDDVRSRHRQCGDQSVNWNCF